MKPQLIRASLDDARLSVRAAAAPTDAPDTGPERTLSGRIATYGATVHPRGPWPAVRLAAGALKPSLSVKLLADHDGSLGSVIGSMLTDGMVTEDDGSVWASFRLANTTAADDVAALIEGGHVDGLSVGFAVRDGQDVTDPEYGDVFEVSDASLLEVSVVSWPADQEARVARIAASEGTRMTATVTEPVDRGVVPVGGGEFRFAEEISAAVKAALAEHAPQLAAPLEPAPVFAGAPTEQTIRPDGYGRYVPGYRASDGRTITAGDYISSVMKMRDGDQSAYASINQSLERDRRIWAAAADDTSSLVPGLLPLQILQPIIDTLSPIRPLFDSLAARAMPSLGSKFMRPTITEHVAVGEQTAELSAVASNAMEVELNDVTKRTIAGALRLSVQSLDWSTPALLDLVVSDFAKVYARWTEQDVSKNFATAATGTPVSADLTDPAATNAAMYKAAVASWTAAGAMPDRVWLSLNTWAEIGSQVDKEGRPLYPFFGQSVNSNGSLAPANMLNAEGNSLGSFRPVVCPYVTGDMAIVGPRDYFEVYEDRKGMLRVPDPSALGQVIAWYGYIASYPAVPKAFIPIVKSAPPAAPGAPTGAWA